MDLVPTACLLWCLLAGLHCLESGVSGTWRRSHPGKRDDSGDSPPQREDEQRLPFTQVTVSVDAQPGMLTRDLVYCLERAAGALRMNGLPVDSDGCHYYGDYGYTGVAVPQYSVHWRVHARLCTDKQAFFPDKEGPSLPPWLEIAGRLSQGSLARHIYVILQGTPRTTCNTLAWYLTEAADSIAAGASEGGNFDEHRCGYAFLVIRPASF
ncbi:TPA: hypothetical protein OOF41_004291 [Citrobacter freundii]|nr:hypothetical protein [Citrobacter freundii]